VVERVVTVRARLRRNQMPIAPKMITASIKANAMIARLVRCAAARCESSISDADFGGGFVPERQRSHQVFGLRSEESELSGNPICATSVPPNAGSEVDLSESLSSTF